MAQTYDEDAVQQILRLALMRQGQAGDLTRSQLIDIAQDLGISPANLLAAEEEWQAQQEERHDRQEFERYRRQQLHHSIAKFAIINSFLVVSNLLIAHSLNWSTYVLLGWGLVLSLQTWRTFQTEGDDYDRAFRRWRLRQQIGQSFKALSERFKLSPSAPRSTPASHTGNAPATSSAAWEEMSSAQQPPDA
ncbi:MAG: 2TM domain-containing protein [Synechococcales bacterium]|nr:2TM domain-containing protein [Synechococcales bacterium]